MEKIKNEIKNEWLTEARHQIPHLNEALLTKALQFAENLQDIEKPPFAESSFKQGLQMAHILTTLRLDSETIATAIIYPGIYYNHLTTEQLSDQFDKDIIKLINGVKRMEAIHDISQWSSQVNPSARQMENLRKMLLAMVDDVRIVLIKLAERLAMLNYLEKCSRPQQIEIANQTLHIYAPLANRLGIGHMKSQIEDLSFRFLYPNDYEHIQNELNKQNHDRKTFIQQMTELLTQLFKDNQIENISIKGRPKHIYSIYRKMQKKHVDFSQIFDTIAFRVIVPTIQDCYTVLGIVHSAWKHIPKEFDDYIVKPKPNGYQSIHTVVVGPNDVHAEIQIRTHQMNEEAELGVAAHWKYKESGRDFINYQEKIAWLRDILDWQKELTTEKPGGADLYAKIFSDRVYVFTPNGEIYDLPAGATPLDFAYSLHSDIGNHCRGAKVNEVLVPLSYKLKTGDRVQILTDKNTRPSLDWLNPHIGYLNTNLAKNKVRHWFRKENYQENLRLGNELWEKTANRENLSKNDLNKVFADFNFKSADDLLAALGTGDITVHNILHHLQRPEKATKIIEEIKPSKPAAKIRGTQSHLSVEGIGNLLTQLARCCKPIPGDLILGYITKGRGITIHQKHCANILHAQKTSPQRLIDVNWGSEKLKSYPVDIVVEADDRPGLIRDISSVVSGENLPIVGVQTHLDKTKNIAYIYLTLEIPSLEPLQRVLNQIKTIPQVTRVARQ